METKETALHVFNPDCGSRRVLALIADRWTVLVICLLALRGIMRFGQIQQTLDISQKVLTQTLRKLEQHGLVKRIVYPAVPPKVEYALTDLGLTLMEPMNALCRWADAHLADVDTALASQQDHSSD
ncbi:MAG TPA: helix-turn-helix domain-containing protein [Ktedonobacteraceae bacterium]|nr:helix-turn-helix domain-containing protein [Ktedonobacteraceae bacterium]